ncbi:MAG: hypothetical protein IPG77_19285 [Betaproteobacteria bacterium]|nr:hypothetical protein [Betaproteobacteria bacterium]
MNWLIRRHSGLEGEIERPAPISSRCGSQIRPSASVSAIRASSSLSTRRRAGPVASSASHASLSSSALPAQHELAHRGRILAAQAVPDLRRNAAQLRRRTGINVVGARGRRSSTSWPMRSPRPARRTMRRSPRSVTRSKRTMPSRSV